MLLSVSCLVAPFLCFLCLAQVASSLGIGGHGRAFGGGFSFWKTRSSAIDREEHTSEEDLGLDPADSECVAWQARNKAEEELAATSAQAWARPAEAREQAALEPTCLEMLEDTEPTETVIEPPVEEGRDPEPAVDDSEVEDIVIDTPPQNNVAERAEEGCTGDAAPGGAPGSMPAGAPETTPAGAPESMPAGAPG